MHQTARRIMKMFLNGGNMFDQSIAVSLFHNNFCALLLVVRGMKICLIHLRNF